MSDFKPYKIDEEKTEEIRSHELVLEHLPPDWTLYAVDQSCGTTYYDEEVVTVPTWVWDSAEGKLTWYVAHELSHVLTYLIDHHGNHGRPFQERLKRICPKEYQHFEYDYKPSLAKAAGLSKKDE